MKKLMVVLAHSLKGHQLTQKGSHEAAYYAFSNCMEVISMEDHEINATCKLTFSFPSVLDSITKDSATHIYWGSSHVN